jgi:hypothetical protein
MLSRRKNQVPETRLQAAREEIIFLKAVSNSSKIRVRIYHVIYVIGIRQNILITSPIGSPHMIYPIFS